MTRTDETIRANVDESGLQDPLPEWLQRVLDERIEADEAQPDAGSPWEEVKKRILESL